VNVTCCQGRRREAARNQPARELPVEFEYRGGSALTAVGSVTGRVYWFGSPGSRLRVHPWDAPSLDGVPTLRRV
jgi:hypothetical protein